MNRRNFFALTLGVATTALIVGCGGGGGKEAARTTTFTPRGSGGVRGFVFRAADGALSLGYTASAPAGSVPATGATVAVGAISGVCGADGGFALDGIATGQATLKVSGNGKTLDAPLTIVDGVSVQVGDPPFTRNQAIEAVKALLSAEGNLEGVEIFMPQQPLPASVKILGALEAADVTEVGIALVEPRWFIYVDLFPGARFGHSVLYYLVDPVIGSISRVEAESWPTLNGLYYFKNSTDSGLDGIQIQKSWDSESSIENSVLPNFVTRNHQDNKEKGKSYILHISGFDDGGMVADSKSCLGFIRNRSFSGSFGKVIAASQDDFRGGFATMTDLWQTEINAVGQMTKPEDTFIFHVSSHGNILGDGSYTTYYDRLAPSPTGNLGAAQVNPGLISFDAVNACHILVIVDTCYSQGWIDSVKKNLTVDCKGKQIAILTATDREHKCWGMTTNSRLMISMNLKQIRVPEGGFLTQGLLYALNNVETTGDFYDIVQKVFPVTVDFMRKCYAGASPYFRQMVFSNPQMWLRPVDDPSEPCPGGQQNVTVN